MQKTNRFLAAVLACCALLAPLAALAQNTVLQGGPTSAGHAPMYSTTGGAGSQPVVVDSGPASGGQTGLGLSELLQVNRSATANTGTGALGAHNCFYSAPITSAAGYYYLCLDANAQGGGLIAFGNGGVAPQMPLNIVVNGTALNFSNTLPLGQIFIGNASNVATAQSVSGDCVITSSGVLTCTKTNGVAFGPFATGTDAANLTGTVASARISGAYTGITGVGTLTSGATGAGFTVNLTTSTLSGVLATANGGWGVSVAASSGIPSFSSGTVTFLSTTGSGNVVLAAGAAITTPSISGASVSTSSWTGGTITSLPTCTSPGDACPKSYIDSVAAGQTPLAPVRLATAAVLPNTPSYANGAAGVGATLTAGANAAIVVDGVTASLNDRVLVSQQASQLQNGVYTVTTVGSGGAAWVLTRATDADTAAELVNGLTTAVQAGATLTGSKWTLTQPNPITVGTTALPFVETSVPTSTVWSASGSDIYNNNAGNVGIGTGAVALPGLLTVNANSDGRVFFTRTAVANSFVGLGTTFDVWSGANVDMKFGTNDVEAMRITTAGRVGVGTTTPAVAMDVVGAMTTRRTTAANVGGTLNIGKGTAAWQIIGNQLAGGDLLINNPAAATVMYFAESLGYVGIGTTAPAAPLHVVANAGGESVRLTGAGTTGNASRSYITFMDSNGSTERGLVGDVSAASTDIWLYADTGNLQLYAAGTLSATLTSTAMALGTATPGTGSRLTVSGSQFLTVTNPTMQLSDCYGFGGGACETDGLLSHVKYSAGAGTTGSAVRGEVLLEKASSTAIGVSGIASNVTTGVSSELVGIIGITDWNGAGSGNAVWGITAGTGASVGAAGAIAATNRATFTPAWGLIINHEGPATSSFVTAIDAGGYTSFGLVLRNGAGATYPIYVNNSGGTNVYNVNAAGTVFSASDARLKRDMGLIPDGALALIAKLVPRNYSFRDDAKNHKDAGFFAQEVRGVIDEAIESDPTGSLMMTQGPLIAYAVKAIQELKADNDNLRDCLRSAKCRFGGLP